MDYSIWNQALVWIAHSQVIQFDMSILWKERQIFDIYRCYGLDVVVVVTVTVFVVVVERLVTLGFSSVVDL